MFGKTGTAYLVLLFLLLCAPALSHGLEDRVEVNQKENNSGDTEARPEFRLQQESHENNRVLFLTTSSEPAKEQQNPNSFLQDQLEQKSPVYLWVPGRGAVGVGVTMTW
jgi:hypothetical protein